MCACRCICVFMYIDDRPFAIVRKKLLFIYSSTSNNNIRPNDTQILWQTLNVIWGGKRKIFAFKSMETTLWLSFFLIYSLFMFFLFYMKFYQSLQSIIIFRFDSRNLARILCLKQSFPLKIHFIRNNYHICHFFR